MNLQLLQAYARRRRNEAALAAEYAEVRKEDHPNRVGDVQPAREEVIPEAALYHGTNRFDLPSIQSVGLIPAIGSNTKNAQGVDKEAEVHLTTDPKVARKYGDTVLKIDTEHPDVRGFRHDPHEKKSLKTPHRIPPDAIEVLETKDALSQGYKFHVVHTGERPQYLVLAYHPDANTTHADSKYSYLNMSDWTPRIFDNPHGMKKENLVGSVRIYRAGGAPGVPKVHYGSSLHVHPDHRRKGVASEMYNHFEKTTGISLKPENLQTSDGENFWKTRSQTEARQEYLYHGTSSIYHDSIMKNGLHPSTGQGVKGSTHTGAPLTYLTSDSGLARDEAMKTCHGDDGPGGVGGHPVVYKIHRPTLNKLGHKFSSDPGYRDVSPGRWFDKHQVAFTTDKHVPAEAIHGYKEHKPTSLKKGDRVKVNSPGHPNHGLSGTYRPLPMYNMHFVDHADGQLRLDRAGLDASDLVKESAYPRLNAGNGCSPEHSAAISRSSERAREVSESRRPSITHHSLITHHGYTQVMMHDSHRFGNVAQYMHPANGDQITLSKRLTYGRQQVRHTADPTDWTDRWSHVNGRTGETTSGHTLHSLYQHLAGNQ